MTHIGILLILSILNFPAHAGGDLIGNGGDAVICGDKVEVLDHLEARRSKHRLDTPKGKNYIEMLQYQLNKKLSNFQGQRLQRYLQNSDSFLNEVRFISNVKMDNVRDSDMIILPENCRLEQIAIQLPESELGVGKKRYTIRLDLWNRLDEFNKMTLVLHEIVYREAIENGANDSWYTRLFVGYLIKNKLDLPMYLQAESRIAKSIEFKQSRIEFGHNKFPFTYVLKNEKQEEILEIVSPLLYVNGIPVKDKVQIRISDGKIIKLENSHP